MSEETSSAEPGFLRLLGLVAITVPVAFVAAAAMVCLIYAVTPDAATSPQSAVKAVSRPIATIPHVSRVKPLLTHLKRLYKPIKRRRARR